VAPRLDPPLDRSRDHVRGPEGVPVLVEYGDFECPYCRDAFPSIRKVIGRMDGQVAFAFRHLPIAAKHPHAEHAAEASEAAAAQGRFWEMHDKLFENRSALEDDDLIRYAGDLGVDVERFATDLREGRYAPRVREDLESAMRMGLTGTPSFFIDDERYGGFYDVESLTWALEDALAA
jgi:protein-disulfide isomerase